VDNLDRRKRAVQWKGDRAEARMIRPTGVNKSRHFPVYKPENFLTARSEPYNRKATHAQSMADEAESSGQRYPTRQTTE
jgi:hypothetical protein